MYVLVPAGTSRVVHGISRPEVDQGSDVPGVGIGPEPWREFKQRIGYERVRGKVGEEVVVVVELLVAMVRRVPFLTADGTLSPFGGREGRFLGDGWVRVGGSLARQRAFPSISLCLRLATAQNSRAYAHCAGGRTG